MRACDNRRRRAGQFLPNVETVAVILRRDDAPADEPDVERLSPRVQRRKRSATRVVEYQYLAIGGPSDDDAVRRDVFRDTVDETGSTGIEIRPLRETRGVVF